MTNEVIPNICKGCVHTETCLYLREAWRIEDDELPFAILCNLKKSVEELIAEEAEKKATKVEMGECCMGIDESDNRKAYFIQNAVGQASFHGETWYKCPYCDFTFEYWDAVHEYNGIKRTSESDQYICPKCKKIFNIK